MKAVELGTGGIDGLALVDRPAPTPGYGQVKLRVRAVSLNYRDLAMLKNAATFNLRPPLIPCSDGAGEVVEAGPGVTRVKVGDRVTGIFTQNWLAGPPAAVFTGSSLGGGMDGMLAEHVVLSQEGVVHIPEHLSFEEAATLPCAAVTAWCALISRGNMKAGDSVLVQGTGGVSIFALQFGAMSGARVIVTSSSDAKLAKAGELGAAVLINYRTDPDWEQRVLDATNGEGADHVVEVAGTLEKSLRAVRVGGIVNIIGAVSGGPRQAEIGIVLQRQLRVHGIYVGSREMFEAMNRAVALHRMRPVIDKVFPLSEVRQAYQHMESGAHFGKIVIAL